MDKAEKKRLKQKGEAILREQARAEWEEHMVLSSEQLTALLDHLDEWFPRAGCDHTLRLTRAWAVDNDLDPDAVAASVEHYGGYCDCEVLANVDPHGYLRASACVTVGVAVVITSGCGGSGAVTTKPAQSTTRREAAAGGAARR